MSQPPSTPEPHPPYPWRGVHFSLDHECHAQDLLAVMEKLRDIGVNVIIAEVSYHFAFSAPYATYSFAVSGQKPVSQETARKLARKARECGIRLIPEFDCLSHQGINSTIMGLLREHPEFNQSIHDPAYPNISVHAWCPLQPEVMGHVRKLIDQIISAFEADAFHVGMDEVMVIGTDTCNKDCWRHTTADLFAGVVKDLYDHIAGTHQMPMLMWGDRLVPQSVVPNSVKEEASQNWTADAIHHIPRDIIICDWRFRSPAQYGSTEYPSISHFLSHGFRVWPSGYPAYENSQPLSQRALELRKTDPNVIGFLCTTWNFIPPLAAHTSPSIRDILSSWPGGTPWNPPPVVPRHC